MSNDLQKRVEEYQRSRAQKERADSSASESPEEARIRELEEQLAKEKIKRLEGELKAINNKQNNTNVDYKPWLIGLPFAGCLIAAVTYSSLVGFVLALIMAFMIKSEVANSDEKKVMGTSPIGWFFFVLLLWGIAYPLYMFKRGETGRKPLGWIAIFGVFSLIFGYAFGSGVDEVKSEYTQRLNSSVSINEDVGGVGKWRVSQSVSPIDDTLNVYLALRAEAPIVARYGNKVTPRLYLRCSEGRTQLFVDYSFFITTQEVYPTIRIDKDQAITGEVWSMSSDHEAIFKEGNIPEFIHSLIGKNQLFIKVTPYGESPVDTVFDLRGIEEAIKPLRSACKW